MVLAVVGFVGQADAGLFEVHDVRVGVLGVAEYGDVEDVRPMSMGLRAPMVRVSAALSAAWSMASRAGLIGVAPAARWRRCP